MLDSDAFEEPHDNLIGCVRVRSTPVTVPLGLAGLVGQVYAETRPSVMGVEVIGGTGEDYAINVALADKAETLWFSPDSLEFVDHAPGTEVVVGNKRLLVLPRASGSKKVAGPAAGVKDDVAFGMGESEFAGGSAVHAT